LINDGATPTSLPLTTSQEVPLHHPIKWTELKHESGTNNGDIKITFDNIDLPHQNVNVSIENGELIIDSIDFSVLNRAEEELRKKDMNVTQTTSHDGNKTDSLEIVLIEDDMPALQQQSTATSSTIDDELTQQATTLHFEMPSIKHKSHSNENNDDIKIKTTDKDSDTIFYISNTEVKLIESIPTSLPSNDTREKIKKYPAIYEEDVIVDVPPNVIKTNRTQMSSQPQSQLEKYEEDIVLSPLTSDFDPKDINYIGEAFLDVEESSNGASITENRHIIPLTSDVVIQPVELKDMPSINVPIIGEPPQIELAEMMFSDDYDSKQQQNFHMEEFSPFLLNNRLIKNELPVVEFDNNANNGTMIMLSNKTHGISVNTVINGTNMTTIASPYSNVTAVMFDSGEEIENAGESLFH
jgi:hypothetical protein